MSEWEVPNLTDVGDLELAALLRHLDRKTRSGMRRAANDPVTRAYLQAGLRLLANAVDGQEPDDPDEGGAHPFLTWISRRAVVDEVSNEPDPNVPRQGSIASMRDRWDPHGNYLADLLAVAMTAEPWVGSILSATEQGGFPDAPASLRTVIETTAHANLRAMTTDLGYRVQLLGTAMAHREPASKEPLQRLHEAIRTEWAAIYETLLAEAGLRLRSGWTPELLADTLSALASGLGQRELVAPDERVLSTTSTNSLLGRAILALLVGALEPDADTRTVEDVFDALVTEGKSRTSEVR